MNRTFTYLTATLLLGGSLLLSSCHKNQVGSEPQAILNPRGESNLILHFVQPNKTTLRALSSEDPLQTIHSLRLLFYSTEEGNEVVKYIKKKNISTAKDLEQIIVNLPADNYNLVVIGNATSSLEEATQLGSPLTNLTENQRHEIEDLLHFNSQETFETLPLLNDQGAIDIRPEHFQTIGTTTSEPTSTPLVHLEAVLSRVLVYGIPESNGQNSLTAQDLKFRILNQSKQSSWLRQIAKVVGGKSEEDVNTPIKDRYANGLLTADVLPTELEDKVRYYENPEKHLTPILPNITEISNDILHKYLYYARESVVSPNAYLQATTPCVLIQARYIPNGLTLTQEEGWLNIEGAYYTESQVKGWIQSSRYPTPRIQRTMTEANISVESFSKAFDKGKIKFYHQGHSYYTIYIRHFNDTQAPNRDSYGRYGLVRNNEYRIQLQHISGEGSPTPPDLKTLKAPILESQRLKVAISINSVSTRNQIADL